MTSDHSMVSSREEVIRDHGSEGLGSDLTFPRSRVMVTRPLQCPDSEIIYIASVHLLGTVFVS